MKYFINLLKNIDRWILVIVGIFAIFSVTIIASIHYQESGFTNRETLVQIIAYVIGLFCWIPLIYFHYNITKGHVKYLYVASIFLLLLVYIPGLGIEQNGARAWINLRVTTIQPSEIVKILYIFIMANYFNDHYEDLYNFKGLLKSALVAAPIILIVLKEDLGSALVFSSIWLFMVFFAGIKLKPLGQFFGLVAAFVPVGYMFMADYQKERIESFLHPDNLNIGGNYQVYQSKIAIGSGGLFGQGVFNRAQMALDYVPIQSSDFIFAVIIEETGFLGGMCLIGLFTIFFIRLTKIFHEAYDFYGALIVVGVIGMFMFQVFENIAMTMGLMPVTGITLPFISYGGSSIISNMMAVGIILGISARNKGINF